MSRDDTQTGSTAPQPEPFRLESLTGRVLDERYAVEELLGQGAMGAVFRARQVRLRRTVAVKVPKPDLLGNSEFMGRFEREALTMAKLVHENIVQIFDVCASTDASVPSFIVMEYVEGAELEKFLRTQEHSLTVAALVDILAQIARGLDAAHARGVVHRDIKPSNIVVTMPHRVPKIMDFGIARIEMENVYATQEAAVIGTPAYMAPEQVKGQPVTPAADIYAFAMMIYRLLARQLPFDADTQTALLYAHVQQEPIPIHQRNPGIPPKVWDALRPALSKEPGDRPPSASIFIEGIEKALEPISQRALGELFSGVSGAQLAGTPLDREAATMKQGAPAAPPATAPTGQTPRRSLALPLVVGALALCALLAASAVVLMLRKRAGAERETPLAAVSPTPSPTATPTVSPTETPAPEPARATPAPTPAAATPTPAPPEPTPQPRPTPQPSPVATPRPTPPETPGPTPPRQLVRDEPRWNVERNPPDATASLQLRHRNTLNQFADERIEIPTTRGQFEPEINALAALAPNNPDARRLLDAIEQARSGPFTSVALSLTLENDKTHYWETRAHTVFDLTVTARPTTGRRTREVIPLLRGDDVVEMWLVLKEGAWEPLDMRVRWPDIQRLTQEIDP